jgi:uncharacterized protein (TIGR00269 family)
MEKGTEEVTGCDKCMSRAVTLIRYSGAHLCDKHFCEFVDKRVRKDLKKQMEGWDKRRRTRIAVALSGGKDSMVTLDILKRTFSKRKNVGLFALLIDEGVKGYRPVTIKDAERFCEDIDVPLITGSFEVEWGLTMDEIARLPIEKSPCTYCGVLRRWLLNVMAKDAGATFLATGLNLDDTAQSVLMNIARGDVERLSRLGPHARVQKGLIPRLQPLRVIPEKESYLYAMLKGLGFSDVECPYAPRAERNRYRRIVFDLEDETPGTRHRLLQSYEVMKKVLAKGFRPARLNKCRVCREPTMKDTCEACKLVAEARKLMKR